MGLAGVAGRQVRGEVVKRPDTEEGREAGREMSRGQLSLLKVAEAGATVASLVWKHSWRWR